MKWLTDHSLNLNFIQHVFRLSVTFGIKTYFIFFCRCRRYTQANWIVVSWPAEVGYLVLIFSLLSVMFHIHKGCRSVVILQFSNTNYQIKFMKRFCYEILFFYIEIKFFCSWPIKISISLFPLISVKFWFLVI